MLEKVGKNAYKIELPKDYGVSPTFNVIDLSPYHYDENGLDLGFRSHGGLTQEFG